MDAGGPFGRTGTPEYRAINPTGLVPAIEENGFSLRESNAIARYLARRYGEGALWPRDVRTVADADRWMDWQQTAVWTHLRPSSSASSALLKRSRRTPRRQGLRLQRLVSLVQPRD